MEGVLSSPIYWFLSLGGIIWLLKEICSCKEYFVIRNGDTDSEVRLPTLYKLCELGLISSMLWLLSGKR